MEIVLVPGFWLNARAWEQVTPTIEAAGHHTHPLTLPGLEAVSAPRAGIGVVEHVAAITAAVDAAGDPGARDVVLVGHSGGGPLANAALDARPDRVARIVFVDSAPLPPGGVIPSGLEPVDGEVALPAWDDFEDEDLVGLDDELRAAFRRDAVPEPGDVVTGAIELRDDARRRAVPATVIACEFPEADLRRWVASGEDFCRELGALDRYDVVELPTGHWPMFTRPADLGSAIAEAAAR
ncbi:esterase [Leifsonia sp. LS1]|uniref:alpha/beta fold hydrolase n=1 Tax=Leifsonia sp. LS1 TaxID=2828483 RepID=UPI001CFE4B60|nr:alpha/beta hydrolase [Leifsonia sp. LS1]GIT81882.1 esterase [Leifsonia sp. LS1]